MNPFGATGGMDRPPHSARNSQEDDTKAPSRLDYLTRLVFPLLFFLGSILRFDHWGTEFWILITLAVLTFAIGLYSPTTEKVETWRARRRDRKRARNAFPQFRRWVARFGPFVDYQAEGTLSTIVRRELRRENITDRHELRMTEERVFQVFWEHLNARVQDQDGSLNEFLRARREFDHLLMRYLVDTVGSAFERLPRVTDEPVPEDAKRELKGFRERIVRFIEDYEEFAASFASSLESRNLEEPNFPRPKPLA